MASDDALLPQHVMLDDGLAADDPFAATTAGDMNFYLQNLLDRKEKQLQQAGNLGQRVLAQQMELEERIRQIQEFVVDKPDEEEVDHQARVKYRELSDTILSWDSENAQLSSAFGTSAKRYTNGTQPSPSPAFAELPNEVPEHKRPSGSAAGQSRRAKNAANRSFIDPEFAMDIGNNLLAEIRRLQSLLTERDKAIQDMKEERDDLEKTVEALKTTLKQQERSSDKYKEENWNLEVTLQELRSQLTESQGTAQRLDSEHKKLTKSLSQARDSIDQYKTESEKLSIALSDLKSKHETDVATARKHAAGLARDKLDLQQTIDRLKTDVARANRRLPKFGSPLTPGAGDHVKDFITPAGTEHDDAGTDIFTGGASTNRRKYDTSGLFPADAFTNEFDQESPESSPIRRPFMAPNHPNNEIEALQQRLAHAQRQINTLKGSLNREKQMRIRLETQNGSAVTSGNGSEEEGEGSEDDEEPEVSESASINTRPGKPRRGGTPFKVGALGGRGTGSGRRGRGGRGGITLIQRLGMAASSPASDFNYGDDDYNRESSPPPPVPPIPPINFHPAGSADEEEENFFNTSSASILQGHTAPSLGDEEDEEREQSPPPPASNRTSVASVEGMDPVFANVLKRVSSTSSAQPHSSSPLRHSLLSRRGSARRSSRGMTGSVGRRSRGGSAFKEARPPSLVNDNPSALAAELGLGGEALETSPMKTLNAIGGVVSPTKSGFGFGEEDSIREEEDELRAWRKEVVGDDEGEQEEGVEEVEMREFGCQTDPLPEFVEVQMQTEELPAPKLVESSVGTDPLPTQPVSGAALIPRAVDGARRTTITQADLSLASSYSSGSTITHARSFLLSRAINGQTEEDYDEGEETETGAETDAGTETETETDYYDARASIAMTTPSGQSRSAFSESRESFHSIETLSDHEFPDSDSGSEGEEEDTRRIRVGQAASADASGRSSVASYYTGHQVPMVTYDEVGVGADLTPEPDPVVVIKEVIKEVQVPVEVIREVPVEVVREVQVPVEVVREVEVVKEVPVEVIKEVQVPVEVIREVQVPVEVVKEVRVEVPVEVVREVVKEVEVPVVKEVVKEVQVEVPVEILKEVVKEVKVEVPVQKDVEVVREVIKEVEVVKEVRVEVPVTKEVEVIREVRVEVPVEVLKEIRVEVPVEVIKEVPVETIREVVKEVPVEVIKEVPVEVIKEVIKEVPVEVIREITVPAPVPEVKEMEIQTDEIPEPEQPTIMDIPMKQLSSRSVQVTPPASPVPGPVFVPPPMTNGLSSSVSGQGAPASPGLYRVNSTGHGQQFQFVAPAPPASSPPILSPISPIFRNDAVPAVAPTLLSRGSRLSSSDRRQSVESAISSIGDVAAAANAIGTRSVLLNATDKTKPPMMVLPPPPKAPPPTNSMAPPPFIPERRAGGPPPRPSSPPPPELIQRATTPTFGSVLNVPGVSRNLGAFGSIRTMSPSTANMNLRQLPSTSTFRSAGHQQVGTALGVHSERRQFSTTSLALSERSGVASPRSSISSSEHGHRAHGRNAADVSGAPSTPNRTADMTPRANGQATDPAIIHAITQTMIGEFLYKYTRKAIGKGHGERRHRRFFWVHPYTKTLYWSSSDPGSSNVNESSAKSAYIEGVRSVLDPNPMPPGLYQYSVVVSTPQREMKITAPTKERHDIWLNALRYLLSRPSPNVNVLDESPVLQSPIDYQTDDDHEHRRQRLLSSPQSYRSSRRGTPGDTWNTTPRGKRSRSQLSVKGSVGKRSGTPALEYLRWNGPESPYSPTKSFVDVERAAEEEEDLDFELHDESMSDGGFEGLENVRACCDGRHTVGHSRKHHHHHLASHPINQLQAQAHAHTAPIHARPSMDNQHLDPNPLEIGRPVSPAWSLRSKAGSTQSHEGGGGLFSWARGEGSKLRFGTKRLAKTSTAPSVDQ
ncbi:hypothetical protein P691DRAFT_762180 [Macrolepiota fuliginosa MF-IS2]|uniref:PH domain-containing protein n=1 Tax=Macrolepiota fuliginosa MF-IS2 TaxID=1400762 RepID=A0A9P6C1R7_9AGAR|nr:hypothetical protein P691DRAFT_762180 [Macrolepiota fuliginosa MF-IS2]